MDIVTRISDGEVDKVLRKLNTMSEKVQQAVNKEIIASAFRIDAEAKGRSPVRTGRLRSSIHIETKKTTSHDYRDYNGKKFTGKLSVQIGDNSAVVGTNVEYAKKMEDRDGFLSISAENERPKFIAAIKKVVKP
jgi:phage gpG-like protein